jgi:hypothetical protein
MFPEEIIIFGTVGVGFWGILVIAVVAIPFWSYLKTGKVWTLSFFRTSYILLKGKKARQNLFIRFAVLCGFGYMFVSMILFNRLAWEGFLAVFVFSVIGIFATFGEKRVSRRNTFWHD